MEQLLVTYSSSVTALGAVAALMLAQVLVVDFLGIINKHIPGSPVATDHANTLFRATRTVGNTNESIAIFICALLFCMFVSASPTYTAYATWGYVLSRMAYAVCYYTNLQILRSVTFGISLLALGALIFVGVFT